MALRGLPGIVAGGIAILFTVGLPAGASAAPGAPHTGAAPVVVPAATDYTEGLRIEATTTYTVDLAGSVIHVEYAATLTNQVPDSYTQSYRVQHYFNAISAPVLVGAVNVAASRDGGGSLPVTVEAGDGQLANWAMVQLRPNLFYGQTQTVRLTYDLPPQPGRSETFVQVNQAFATFPVVPAADPGLGNVRVVLPLGVASEVVGDGMQKSQTADRIEYSASAIADSSEWIAQLIVQDDEALAEQIVDYGEDGVVVRAWPNDAEWLTFTTDLAERGLPALEETIGRPWGAIARLQIVETATPYVYGYGGWYSHDTGIIEVGDLLEPQVILHEMAHAWFNGVLFQERWINEGLADEYAALAMEKLDLSREDPEPVDTAAPGAVALNDWADPDLGAEDTEETEAWGYGASWWLVHELVDEIGTERMALVIDGAATRAQTYPADSDDDLLFGYPDWRRFLDLLENVGESQTAEDLFRDLVLADDTVLDDRAAAREEYQALADDEQGWAPPAAVRDAMAAWEFDEASELMPQAAELFDVRDAVAADLEAVDQSLPTPLKVAFETSENLDELDVVLDDAGAAADALVEAVGAQADADPLAQVGLALFGGVDDEITAARGALGEGAYDEAAESAADATATVEGATGKGALALGGLVLVLAGIGVGVWLVVRRRRRRAAATEPALPVEPVEPPLPVDAAEHAEPAGPVGEETVPATASE